MTEIKTYRIKGRYRRAKRYFYVSKEIRALSLEKALEKFFSETGSQGIKRLEIEIIEIKEIPPIEIKNAKLRKIALAKDLSLFIK